MTNGEIFKIFKEKYPQMNISDYRPLSSRFVTDMQGITIWTDEGDLCYRHAGHHDMDRRGRYHNVLPRGAKE